MGFISFLEKMNDFAKAAEAKKQAPKKRWRDMTANEILHPGRYFYRSLGEFSFPETDSAGHPALTVYNINIVGVLHPHNGINPQDVIPQMFAGDRIILEADPTNEYDDHAVKVKNTDGIQIGWLPKGESLQIDIFDRLQGGQTVYARIKEAYELQSYPGNIGLCIEVARYAK